MAKVANYYITGVWKDAQGRISYVMLHDVFDNNNFNANRGVKTSRADAIRLLKNHFSIMTLTFAYPGWNRGAYVIYETVGLQEFLKTVPNSTTKDNLDNSFPFDSFL